MQELIDIIQEEAEIMRPESSAEQATQAALWIAARRIHEDGPTATLTPKEKVAVKYALTDVGELYLHTGTSAGFDTSDLSEADILEHQTRGKKARIQAGALGIYL